MTTTTTKGDGKMKAIIGIMFAVGISALVCPAIIRLFDNVQSVLDKINVVQ